MWKYSLDQSRKTSIACRELTLPPSELVHSANLICIVSNASSSNPSCIAINPEGHITYWSNIANGSSTVTVNADIPVFIYYFFLKVYTLVHFICFRSECQKFIYLFGITGTRVRFIDFYLAYGMLAYYNQLYSTIGETCSSSGE